LFKYEIEILWSESPSWDPSGEVALGGGKTGWFGYDGFPDMIGK
jgi:hypothetical protein